MKSYSHDQMLMISWMYLEFIQMWRNLSICSYSLQAKSGWAMFAQYISPVQCSSIFSVFFGICVHVHCRLKVTGQCLLSIYNLFSILQYFQYFSVFVFITSYKVAGQYLLSIYHLFSILQYFQYFSVFAFIFMAG